MTVSGSTILHDSVLYVRSLIASGVTDPISATRWTNSGCNLVMTSFPDRIVQYPVITIEGHRLLDERMGTQTQAMRTPLRLIVNVWSKSTKERDTLSDAVYQSLKTNQMSGTEPFFLYDFHLVNEFNVDEIGMRGIHRKYMEFSYFTIG